MAFVEGIDDNECPRSRRPEWANDELLHLRAKGFFSDVGVCRQDQKQPLPEQLIAMSELEGEGGEDGAEVAPVIEIARTKKARSELPVREARLGKRLGDGGFPGSGEAVKPEHAFVFVIIQPAFDLEEDISSSPLHASLSIPTQVSSVGGVIHPSEKGKVRSLLLSS